jgi:hypothetical protein
MKHLKKLGLASAIALIAVCGMAGSASATTIDPPNTAVTLTSTNSALSIHGGSAITCAHSTIVGTTPPHSSATWLSIPATLAYSNCLASGFTANITQSASCHAAGTQPLLHVMALTDVTDVLVVTLRSCNIHVNIPASGCTLDITGNNQTIGNGTAAAGGIGWTNSSTKSFATASAALVSNIDSNGVGPGCGTAGPGHTGTLGGTYTISSATNVTITT